MLLLRAQPLHTAVNHGRHATLHAMALLALDRGDANRAACLLQEVLVQCSEDAVVLNNWGVALHGLSDFSGALEAFSKAVKALSDCPEPVANLAYLKSELGDQFTSEKLILELLESCGSSTLVLAHLPDAFIASCALNVWHPIIQHAFDNNPKCAQLAVRLAKLQMRSRCWDAAASTLDHVLTYDANHIEAICLLAMLGQDHRLEELQVSLQSIQAKVNNINEQILVLEALAENARLRRDVNTEIGYYNTLLRLDPSNIRIRVSRAKAYFLTGNFQLGWEEFLWRWKQPIHTLPHRGLNIPLWCGEYLKGQRILLHSEQGQGDCLQFVRYVALIAAQGAEIVLEAPSVLTRLMRSLVGVNQVIALGDQVPSTDWHCPLMTLPLLLNTDRESPPSSTGYLRCSQESFSKAEQCLNYLSGFRVGLAWAGAAHYHDDRRRSMPLSYLNRLADINKVAYVSLQCAHNTNDVESDTALKLFHCADVFEDYDTTAGFITHLDLIIAVDTSVAHLAGALGKEVWILLPYAGNYRWLLNRDDTPWYSKARLFRQPRPGDWAAVIEQVFCALKQRLSR